MNTIAAIPTEYKGYRFRSRLEARWAVFFDLCGMQWEYEPEGFSLGDGRGYLPDFLLHNVETLHAGGTKILHDLWVEVKGELTKDDAEKILIFCGIGIDEDCPNYPNIQNPTYVVVGFPDGDTIDDVDDFCCDRLEPCGMNINPYGFYTVDGDWDFPGFPGLNDKLHFELFGADSGYVCSRNDDATLEAFRIARQVRFDHGKTPTYQWVKNVRINLLWNYA